MSAELESAVSQSLQRLVLPGLSSPLSAVAGIAELHCAGGEVSVSVMLGFAAKSCQQLFQQVIADEVRAVPGVSDAVVSVSWEIMTYAPQQNLQNMENVRNIIAVASGKGGVGKSTTTVNLALALAAEGAKVGILDADIYGPSQQMLLGVAEGVRPKQYGTHYLLPVEAHGLQSMSMAYLVTDKTPMVWRGPMATGALQQLLYQTYWQDLDYLLIDMPPGTGDIHLTLSQKVPVSGAVVVTTPQDIALLDARKGIEMFQKVSVPVLGVIENMAVHICGQCGYHEHIFGEGGGQSIAADYGVKMLGSLPLSLQIREQADCGQPVMIADPAGEVAASYRQAALAMAATLAERQRSATAFPNIKISDE